MITKKIKIVFITPWLYVGGAERILIDLITNLDLNRFAVSVVFFNKSTPENEIWHQELVVRSIPIVVFNNKKTIPLVGGILRMFKVFWQLTLYLKKTKPDIVQTQLFGDFYGRIAAWLAGVPIILSVEHNINIGETWSLALVKKLTMPLLDRLIVVSKAVGDYAVKHYKISKNKVVTIYNGVDVNKFYISPLARQLSSPPVIGAMGRLTKQKGFATLIRAMKLVNNQTAICLIAGEGEDRATLQALINDSGLKDRIKLIGIQKDTKTFLANLDIFIIPSLWEGLGIVALEAGLAGLPVVASAVDGLKEIIQDGKNGWLVEPGDNKSLAKIIDDILNHYNDSVVKDRENKLQAFIMDYFSLAKAVTNYQSLYEQLFSSITKKK
jgi:glycosyltransferase involved in cell wall biosynthesis